MSALIITLRLIHILGGVFWVGTMLFNTFFLLPALSSVGPVAGTVGGALQQRGFPTVVVIAALATIGSGLWLYWLASGGSLHAFGSSPTGMALATGGLLGIVAFGVGMTVTRPAFLRMNQLGQGLATASGPERDALTQQMAALRARSTKGGLVVAWLLIGAVGAMAVARYM